MPSTVGEVRAFLGLAGYLRNFVPDFSTLTAPITDLLRDKKFSSKRARKLRVPWGAAQTEAFQAVISALITHPVLAVPDWNLPFALHTDASELAAGAVLTQEVENREAPLGYASHRFTRTEEEALPERPQGSRGIVRHRADPHLPATPTLHARHGLRRADVAVH